MIPSPSTVKKTFSGNGRATKDIMHEAFLEKTGVSLSNIIGKKPKDSPVSDLVDSYAMIYHYLNAPK